MKKMVKPAISVLLALTMGMSSLPVFAATNTSRYFSDVNPESYGWAGPYVDIIAEKGIASGVGNNKFAPGNLIKRGDFAIFVDKTFKLDTASDTLFNLIDVSPTSYYYQSVVNCKMAQVVTDVYNFNPESNIKRIDAINIIYNALKVQNLIGSKGSTDISKYADSDQIVNMQDKVSVGTLTNLNIITGSSDGKLYPNDTLTRAEMAVVFAKVSSYVDDKKDELAKEAEKKKQQEIEDSKANVEDTKDEDNNTNKVISSGNVDYSVAVDTGKKVSMHDITLEIPDQTDSAVKVSNNTTLRMTDSVLRTLGYAALDITDGSSASVKNLTVEADSPNAVVAAKGTKLEADNLYVSNKGTNAINVTGGSVTLDNSTLNVTGDGSALYVGAGSTVDVDNTKITTSKKNSNIITVKNDEYSEDVANITLKNTKLDNSGANLFEFKDAVANILIDNCDINISRFVNVVNDKNSKQTQGCDATIAIKDSTVNSDIVVDNKTKLTLDIQSGGSYRGFIDQNMYSQDINIKIADDGKLELNGDIYVKDFITTDMNFNNIVDNGFNIYYDDTAENNNYLYADTYDLTYGGQLLPR